MNVIILILLIAGQPERVFALLPEQPNGMAACNAAGLEAQKQWTAMFNREPKDFTYRCVPGILVKTTET